MTKDDLVQEIGAMLIADPQLSSRSWDHLVMVAQITKRSSQVNGFCYQTDGEATPASPGNFAVLKKLRALQVSMQEPGKEPWQACLMRIERASGRMSIDFEYDDPKKWWIGPSTVKQMAETLRPRRG